MFFHAQPLQKKCGRRRYDMRREVSETEGLVARSVRGKQFNKKKILNLIIFHSQPLQK